MRGRSTRDIEIALGEGLILFEGGVRSRLESGPKPQPAPTRAPGLKPDNGAIAQLGERLHGMQEVSGSIPLGSTKSPNDFKELSTLDSVAGQREFVGATPGHPEARCQPNEQPCKAVAGIPNLEA